MALYLNPGNESFLQGLNSQIYVDKSLILKELNNMANTDQKLICMSRARRFGKTMVQSLIAAYYSKGCDSKELFAKLKIGKELTQKSDIEKFKKNINTFNLIQLDFNGYWSTIKTEDKDKFFDKLNSSVKTEFVAEFPNLDFSDCHTIADCVGKVYSKTGQTFVILIDEYDFFVRNQCSETMFQSFLDLLIGLFKNEPLKPAISLAFLTGILPIVRDRIQSKLNNFDEYTMISASPLENFIGFTKDEVANLCKQYCVDEEEIKRWYDGYKIDGVELFNSNSVVKAMLSKSVKSYWSKTGSFEVVTAYMRSDFEGIQQDVAKLIGGQSVRIDVDDYLNTLDCFDSKDSVFTYLVHLGYLGYNPHDCTCFIPNYEVSKEWLRAIRKLNNFGTVPQIIKESDELLESVIWGDGQAVADSLKRSHSLVMSNLQYNNEACFASAIMLSFISAKDYYTVFMELPTGDGFADVVMIPYKCDKPALIIELKIDTAANTAIKQIYDKNYGFNLEQYRGNTRFVGISYNRESKEHYCKIEKW